MAIGSSGRIVMEIDPELKQELYLALDEDGMRMKQWFLENVEIFLQERSQPSLPFFRDGAQSKEVKS